MDKNNQNENRLISYLVDELTEDEKWELEQAFKEDGALALELEELRSTLGQVTPAEPMSVSSAFDHELRVKLDALARGYQIGKHTMGNKSNRIKRWLQMLTPVAAAAMILLGITIWPNGDGSRPTGSNILWADVVKAMETVKHCHVTAFGDDPRSSDEEKRLYKINFYYQHPGMWRAEGFNEVHFVNNGPLKVYDATKRKFVETKTKGYRRRTLIPPSFVKDMEAGRMMEGILKWMFSGKLPKGEPVKSTEVETSGGIEVFDYARDANYMWARVWVLKNSKLPIRIKMYQPRWEEYVTVTFDYTESKPVHYFDAAHFEKIVKEKKYTKPYQIMQAGSERIAGKPVNTEQVRQLIGGYTPPKVLRGLGVEDGTFALVTTNPGYLLPYTTDELWRDVHDNWGNRYVILAPFYGRPGGDDPVRHYYFTPLLPFQRGQGKRVVYSTLATNQSQLKKNEISFRKIKEYKTVIGFDDLKQFPKRFVRDIFHPRAIQVILDRDNKKRRWPTPAWQRYELLVKQYNEKMSAENKTRNLLDQYHLLKTYGRFDRAAELMRDRLIPLYLEDPFASYFAVDYLGRFMIETYRKGDHEKFMQMYEVVTKKRHAILKSLNTDDRDMRNRVQLARNCTRNSAMRSALLIPESEQRFANEPVPSKVTIKRFKEGWVLVQVAYPKASYKFKNGNEIKPHQIWYVFVTVPKGKQRRYAISQYDEKSNSRFWAAKTDAKQVTIDIYRSIVIPRYGGGAIRKKITIGQFDVPGEVTGNVLKEWWMTRFTTWKTWPGDMEGTAASTFNADLTKANIAYHAEEYGKAKLLYEVMMKQPKENWPSDYSDPQNNAWRDYTQWQKDQFQIKRLICQVHMGQMEQALAEVARQIDKLPEIEVDAMGIPERWVINRYQEWRSVKLIAVRVLIKNKQLDQAKVMLDALVKQRPDLTPFMDVRLSQRNDQGHFRSWRPRGEVRRSWDYYERVLWSYQEAKQQ